MPINRIAPTPRGKAAVVGAVSAAALATGALIKPWEGRELKSYQDVVGVWTICYGETKDIGPGMKATESECEEMLTDRLVNDYERPLIACIPGFKDKPISWRAVMLSGAYNLGVGTVCRSSAARLGREGRYRESCEELTAFNRAGGKVVNGLVKRREMGDRERIGEAELCVSGL